MSAAMQSCAIAVMAKTPQPGRSKTRLVPPLTYEQAAAMSAAFLRDTTGNIAAVGADGSAQGYVAYAPAGLEALLAPHLAAGTRLLLADGTPPVPEGVRGFGCCLLHAMRALLAPEAPGTDAAAARAHHAACVLNSDSPTLPGALLAHAVQALAAPGDRVVLGPAEDGGYYLLGLKAPHAAMFADIDWSTDRVAAQTRERAAGLGLEVVELAPWFDVDDAASLRRLLEPGTAGPHAPSPAPATMAQVAALGLRSLLGA